MKWFRTLHFQVPALVFFVGLVLIITSYMRNEAQRVGRRVESLRLQAFTEGTRLSGIAQHLSRKNLPNTTDLEMSYASLTPELALGFICDGSYIIRHSTQLQWRGMNLSVTQLAETKPIIERVWKNMTGSVEMDQSGKHLLAVIPFFERDSRSKAVVLLAYDMTWPLDEARRKAFNESCSQSLGLLAGCLLLWLVLDAMVTRRVVSILRFATEVGAGQMPGMVVEGLDEIGAVGQGFADAVKNLHLTEMRLLEAGEREQRRIGMDLHDDVCQRIAAAQLKAGVLGKRLAKEKAESSALAVEVADDLSTAVNVARAYARGLAPVTLDSDGLEIALQGMTEYLSHAFKVTCKYDCTLGSQKIGPTVTTHLYRILQELATNAAKHAGASRIDIRVTAVDGVLKGEVENDGIAFDGLVKNSKGLGMHLVLQRVRAIQGVLKYLPRRDGKPGTLAVCTVPLDAHTTDE